MTDGQLARAARGAGEQKSGYVGAGNEEDCCYYAEQGEEGLAEVAGRVFGPGLGEHGPAGGLGEALVSFATDLFHSLLSEGCVELLDAYAGLEADGAFELFVEALVGGELVGREAEGSPEVLTAGPVEVAAHDADDAVGLAVHDDGFADGVGLAAEDSLPGGVAEDGYVVGSLLIFFGREDSAEDGLGSEDAEPVAADGGGFEVLGAAAGGGVEA